MPSLKLQELLHGAAARAGLGARCARVTGLSPAATAFYASLAATRDPRHEIVLLVVPTDRDVEEATPDVRFLLGGLEALPGAELEQAVLPFPSLEVDPYRGMAPHLRVTAARARALHALSSGYARIVVASATALVPRVSSPEQIQAASLDLRPGTDVPLNRLAEMLVEAGFTRQDPVDEHGSFCVRGGVVDIFPAGDDQPARLEFVGDTIEMIRRFDPATQRSVAAVDLLRVIPLRDRLLDAGDLEPGAGDGGPGTTGGLSSFFDYLSLSRRSVILVSEPDDVKDRIEKWLMQVGESYADAAGAGRARAGALRR